SRGTLTVVKAQARVGDRERARKCYPVSLGLKTVRSLGPLGSRLRYISTARRPSGVLVNRILRHPVRPRPCNRHDFRSLLPTPRSSAALIGNSSLGASHSDLFPSSHEAKTRQPEGEQGQRGRLGNTESVGFLLDQKQKIVSVEGEHING